MSKKVENEVILTIQRFKGRLSDELVDDYVNLARHNECMIALENLCVQLYEFDIIPSADEYRAIQRVGYLLGLQDNTWSFLAVDE